MAYICGNCFQEIEDNHCACSHCGHENEKNREEFPLALPAGSILCGQYIIGKVLGQGGFGITYLAQDYQTKALVAIKEFFPGAMATRTGTTVMPFSGAQGENFAYGRQTFLEEAETMAQFNGNPNIAGVQMYFEENGTAYFVMEYLDGCSFEDYIKEHGGRLSWADTARVMLPVLDVLELVHEQEIVHRDVSPDNIYITKDGTVKLLDFGAARHSLGNVSQSLDVVIKHGFAPKEQYSRRGRQGSYTDVYAASATIYFALTGAKPDEALDRAEEDNMPPPSILGAKVSEPFEDALMKGLAVEAKDRYQTAAELKAALTTMPSSGGDRPKKPVTETKPETDTKPVQEKIKEIFSTAAVPKKAILAAAAALLVVGFGMFWFLHPHQYGDWVILEEATCETAGSKERECFCGEKEFAEISKLGHQEVIDRGKAATCTETGLTDGSHCGRCGKVLKAKTETEMLEHSLVKIPSVAATCTESGRSEGFACENCDYATGGSTISSLGHNFSGNDCTRCPAKKWWVEFTTTRKTFARGERIEIYFDLCTNEKNPAGISGLILPGLRSTISRLDPKIKMSWCFAWTYSDGSTYTTNKKYFGDGEEYGASSGWLVYWEDCWKSGSATVYIYDDNNYCLGTYSFTVK